MPIAVEVEHVSKVFQRRTDRARRLSQTFARGWGRRSPIETFRALHDVSFRLAPGRMLGVIGRNGAGKSTLLRLLCGIGLPTEGRIETHGAIRALLDLGSTLSPDLTGRENLFLTAIASGLTRSEVCERYDAIVEFAELRTFLHEPVRTYSSGMRARLAFSVAIHTDPAILVVDEALAVGDLAFQNKCLERIAEFRERGCAVVFVSHDTGQVQQLCDEALWLKEGRVEAYGEAREVVERYVDEIMTETRKRTPGTHPVAFTAGGRELRMHETRFGSLELEIRSVALTDDSGTAVEEIRSGRPLTVVIEYEARRPILSPHFVVTILRDDGLVCFNATTELDGHRLPDLRDRGSIALRIERLDLATGLYYVDAAAYEHGWTFAYDFHHRVYPLRVSHRASVKGVIFPPHRWQLSRLVEHPARPARIEEAI